MKATTDAHFCDANVARNPFGWITNNYEISCVSDGRKLGALEAFSEWIAWIKRTWPDVQCPTLAELGSRLRACYLDNDSLAYLLRQNGTGIGASFSGQQVTWFMNKAFRLGVVCKGDHYSVFDYADYAQDYAEPQGLGERNWSLLGAINQKRQRPQDEPMALPAFFTRWPQVSGQLQRIYGEREEVREVLAAS